MKKYCYLFSAIFVLLVCIVIFIYSLFHYSLTKVSSDSSLKEVTIEPGNINSIADTLYKNNLIRNKWSFIIYVRISGKTNLKAATYSLSEDMGVKKIVDILEEGKGSNSKQISVTFKEGLNVPQIAKIISEKTNHSEEEFYNLLSDSSYLEELIEKYWFLTDDILNQDIYYSLEGYLYPNTYYFSSTDVGLEEIVRVMLEEMDKQLSPYQEQIQKQGMTVHEILTLASIAELEGVTTEDRQGIVQVFQNRLKAGMNLGSDVTTYYGAKVEIGARELLQEELNACNSYNTRCATYKELPVSPICNPSISSIKAALDTTGNDYLYFVADKNKKIYFSKTITEHNSTIANLKKNNLWYEY